VRDTLRKMTALFCPQVQIVGEAESVASGYRIIRDKAPDLVLLDIKMEDGTGFDLLNQLKNIDFKVIFITAYEEYALEAFDFSAVDYLLKPVNPEKLANAIQHVEKLVQHTVNIQLEALQENLDPENRKNRKIVLRTHESIHLVRISDIMHCEADGGYTTFTTIEGEKIIVTRLLKEYDDMLSGHGFFRVHRSHLINLQHIKKFDRQDGGYVVLTGNIKVPVSSRSREKLLQLFDKLST
jgi:two-component system LytT family response regulator